MSPPELCEPALEEYINKYYFKKHKKVGYNPGRILIQASMSPPELYYLRFRTRLG